MVWIRVTRVMAETAAIHESILLNTANMISIEQVQDAVYVYLRDGRHFMVTESLETLAAALLPVTAADRPSAAAVSPSRERQGPAAATESTEHAYAIPPRHILVPLDCRAQTSRVLHYALALGEQLQARLTLLHVIDRPLLPEHTAEAPSGLPPHVSVAIVDYLHHEEAARQRTLDTYMQQVHSRGLGGEAVLVHGVPFQQILDLARAQEVDLILMGTQGRTGLHHVFLGSVAEKVVRLAPCPVLVVHGEEAN